MRITQDWSLERRPYGYAVVVMNAVNDCPERH